MPGWVGGAMAGLQSALLSAGAIVAVALAVAAASAPADGTAGIDWEGCRGRGRSRLAPCPRRRGGHRRPHPSVLSPSA